ncbi:MAG: hypothetical protein QG622_762 [Actinomycetota bacterium]|nr:hypothetical protein [Actinomycetota bacterium]
MPYRQRRSTSAEVARESVRQGAASGRGRRGRRPGRYRYPGRGRSHRHPIGGPEGLRPRPFLEGHHPGDPHGQCRARAGHRPSGHRPRRGSPGWRQPRRRRVVRCSSPPRSVPVRPPHAVRASVRSPADALPPSDVLPYPRTRDTDGPSPHVIRYFSRRLRPFSRHLGANRPRTGTSHPARTHRSSAGPSRRADPEGPAGGDLSGPPGDASWWAVPALAARRDTASLVALRAIPVAVQAGERGPLPSRAPSGGFGATRRRAALPPTAGRVPPSRHSAPACSPERARLPATT